MTDPSADPFFEHCPALLCVVEADGTLSRISAAMAAALGYERADLLSRPFLDFVHPDDAPSTARALARRTADATTISFEARFRRRDGAHRRFAWNGAPDPSGALHALARDVTGSAGEAREESGEALRQANRFLEAIIENIPHMVFLKDAETLSFARFNRAGEELLGMSRAELLGKNDHDFFPKEEAVAFQAKDRETLRGRTLVDIPEEPIETKRGRRWLRTKKVPLLDEDGTPRYLLGISEDITDLKQAVEARLRLASIVESSNDAIISATLDGLVVTWNRAAELIFGYPASEIVGKAAALLVPEDQREVRPTLLAGLRRGERVDHFDAVRRRKDGREVDISSTVSPVRDSTGAVVGMSTIARDVTEIKKMRRALEREKSAAEAANRELEAFSYSVAHDLRAPLRSIDGFSRILLNHSHDKLDAEGKRYLSLVCEAAQRMGQLIDDLLTLSRVTRSELRRERVDLAAIGRQVMGRLHEASPQRQVHVVIPAELPTHGDPRLLAVVLENLLGNAWKFTGKREAARIELGVNAAAAPPVYWIKDNGAGFDPTYAGKLFGAFQRLHGQAEFEGTGIGLATVQRIVARHDGRVWAEGQVGEGATFSFTLGNEEIAS
jgi:PAS domain S-box-containing protein